MPKCFGVVVGSNQALFRVPGRGGEQKRIEGNDDDERKEGSAVDF